jgi:hypothetical protein
MIYLICCVNFSKYNNVPSPSTAIKRKLSVLMGSDGGISQSTKARMVSVDRWCLRL